MAAADWVDYNARRFGDAQALETAETGAVITWRELEDAVGRVARVLRDAFGVGPGMLCARRRDFTGTSQPT